MHMGLTQKLYIYCGADVGLPMNRICLIGIFFKNKEKISEDHQRGHSGDLESVSVSLVL